VVYAISDFLQTTNDWLVLLGGFAIGAGTAPYLLINAWFKQ